KFTKHRSGRRSRSLPACYPYKQGTESAGNWQPGFGAYWRNTGYQCNCKIFCKCKCRCKDKNVDHFSWHATFVVGSIYPGTVEPDTKGRISCYPDLYRI